MEAGKGAAHEPVRTQVQTQVLIVGGGPVGMGLAIELGQRGVRCMVVERYATPQPIPKGQNLTQRTMEHFHFWGAELALRAARTIPAGYGIGGLTAHGTLLSPYHYDWLQRDLVRPFYYQANERLPQYATEEVLRERAAAIPSITTLYGWKAETVVADDDEVEVTVTQRDGSGRQSIRADYVVGCDGSRSTVREQAGITQTLSDHDRLMALVVFRSRELHELLACYPGKSYYNVLQPELNGYWKFFGRVDLGETWFFHAPVPPGTTKDNFDFAAYLHEAVGAPFEMEFQHIGFWDLRFAIANRYRAGRVFVAGDAAHSHPPYGGYGVNTGFEDARNLGWKLAARLQGWGGEALLDSYDRERRPVFDSTARDFIAKSIETDRAFLHAHDPARDRDAFEQAWRERSAGAAGEVNAFEPHYEGSPVVMGTQGAGGSAVGRHSFEARSGHHLAPATLSDGRNVYERLGAGFTLLAFGADAGQVQTFADAARDAGVDLTVIEDAATGECARYGVPLVLVRPDQFIAWVGDSAAAPAALELMRTACGKP
jgi:2-polyprenyl-6-methoxyphenol hydroxylase-like FAD-dependent oxidoreductase